MNQTVNFPALLNAANKLMKQVTMADERQILPFRSIMLINTLSQLLVIDSNTNGLIPSGLGTCGVSVKYTMIFMKAACNFNWAENAGW